MTEILKLTVQTAIVLQVNSAFKPELMKLVTIESMTTGTIKSTVPITNVMVKMDQAEYVSSELKPVVMITLITMVIKIPIVMTAIAHHFPSAKAHEL